METCHWYQAENRLRRWVQHYRLRRTVVAQGSLLPPEKCKTSHARQVEIQWPPALSIRPVHRFPLEGPKQAGSSGNASAQQGRRSSSLARCGL